MPETTRISAAALAALLGGLLVHPAPANANEGVGGTATLELRNEATGRKVTSELWFAAPSNARIEWFAPRPPLRAIPIARNAEPRPPVRKHPLIVISHG